MVNVVYTKYPETRECGRCGLYRVVDERACKFCDGLSDSEVEELKLTKEREHIGNLKIAKILKVLLVVFLLFVLWVSL